MNNATCYLLNGYAGGTITQSIVTSRITYTFTPDKGKYLKEASVYRFPGSTLTNVDWLKGTKVAELKVVNNKATYNIQSADAGDSLCLYAVFDTITLQSIGVTGIENIKNASCIIKDNNVSINTNTGYIIKSATLTAKNPYDFKGSSTKTYNFSVSSDSTVATLQFTDTLQTNFTYTISADIEEKPKPVTFTGNYSLVKNSDQLTLKYDNNNNFTITTNDDKYVINQVTARYFTTSDSGSLENGVISNDKHTYTLTLQTNGDLSPSDYQSITFDVDTLEKSTTPTTPTTPTKQIFAGKYYLQNYKDRVTLTYDNNNTFTIKTNDDKYIINSVEVLYTKDVGSTTIKLTNGVISADKHTFTLTLQDGVVELDTDFIRFTVDVADTTPIQPTPDDEHLTQRIYTVSESGLSDFVKQGVSMYQGGTNTNYDYTSFVNQIYTLPFSLPPELSKPVSKIATGLWSINADAREFDDVYATISCGTITVTPEHGNGFDKSVQSVYLHLPFLPEVNLAFDDCYNKKVYTEYVTNLMTGTTTINIYSDSILIRTFNANIKNDLQLFNIYNNNDLGHISSTFKNKIRQAYIKVVYYEPVDNLVSYETLEHNKLSSYTNFVKTKNSIVSCGTQQEQVEIEELLDKGIFINDTSRN